MAPTVRRIRPKSSLPEMGTYIRHQILSMMVSSTFLPRILLITEYFGVW